MIRKARDWKWGRGRMESGEAALHLLRGWEAGGKGDLGEGISVEALGCKHTRQLGTRDIH